MGQAEGREKEIYVMFWEYLYFVFFCVLTLDVHGNEARSLWDLGKSVGF